MNLDKIKFALRIVDRQSSHDVTDPELRAAVAVAMLIEYGSYDGDHHKAWAIDQAIRALTGCPWESVTKNDVRGEPYTFQKQGESDLYRELVAYACDGEDGPDTYEWDEGIAP